MPSLHIAVVGGSIAGCCAAVELARAGHEVDVFERSASALVGQGVAIGMLPDTLKLLLRRDLVDETMPRLAMPAHALVGATTEDLKNVSARIEAPAWSVNWGDLHANLRRRVPDGRYHAGAAISGVADQAGGSVTLDLADGSRRSFDLVVFADGHASIGRRVICPESELAYCRYVLWRGELPVSKLADAAPFDSTVYRISYRSELGHAVAYRMPSGGGDADDPGVVNFGCYRVIPPEELPELLPQGHGRKVLSPQTEEFFKDFAAKQLPAYFAEIMLQGQNTFVQPIFSVRVPRQSLRRICLIGNAAALIQPLTGSGVLRACNHAVSLARRLRDANSVDEALTLWDAEQTAFGRVLSDLGEQMEQRLIWNIPDFTTFDATTARQWWEATTRPPQPPSAAAPSTTWSQSLNRSG